MLMQIDQMGIIEKELNGMLTKDAFVLIRNLISSGAQEDFKPRKEELMK